MPDILLNYFNLFKIYGLRWKGLYKQSVYVGFESTVVCEEND